MPFAFLATEFMRRRERGKIPKDQWKKMFTLLIPNKPLTARMFWVVLSAWVIVAVTIWSSGTAVFLPTPIEVMRAFPRLWYQEGLAQQLWTSFTLYLEAMAIMAALSLVVAYATVMPLFRPFAVLIATGRFNGFVGLPLVFMSMLHNPHRVKVALLVFGTGVFTVLSLVQMIEAIPKERFDHSRTLRMSEWRVVWEEVVLGCADQVIDIMRVNGAMIWMLFPMVEGLFKFEGGVGVMMEVQNKHLNLDMVLGILLVVLCVGLLQDWFIGLIKDIACPNVRIALER